MAFDAASGTTLLFGGTNTCNDFYGDTWRYDGTSWHLVSGSGGPSRRHEPGMVFDEARGEILLFGGLTTLALGGAYECSGETWSFNNRAYSIPAVGTWGLAAMTLLLLCVGTVVAMRRGRSLAVTRRP
jgi:hypothetical protein